MINVPKLEIEYLVNYDLTFTNASDFHPLSDISEVNTNISNLSGKKGLHLSGGSVDEITGEVSGTLLDGTFTFYKDSEKAYNGIMGNELSGEDYSFESQYIDFSTSYDNTYIKSLIIYFDSTASEFATKMSFSNGINADGSENPLYNGSTIIKNNKLIFMYSFGENSTLKSVRLNILAWSKKNALMKILKITTGYTGYYDPATLNALSYTRNKFSDSEQLRFGVSKQTANATVIDRDGMIRELYTNDLFFKNILVYFYVDDLLDGSYYLENKTGSHSNNLWEFDFKDILSFKLDEKVRAMNIDLDGEGNPKSKPLTSFINHALENSINIIYDDGLEDELKQILIPIPFVEAGQTRYDLLLKCCQLGLLRMYSDEFGNLIVTRGI